jgi:hypothetical protein
VANSSGNPAAMTPQQFVEKWAQTELSERAASQEHFIDLCHLIGQPTPAEADATGESNRLRVLEHSITVLPHRAVYSSDSAA